MSVIIDTFKQPFDLPNLENSIVCQMYEKIFLMRTKQLYHVFKKQTPDHGVFEYKTLFEYNEINSKLGRTISPILGFLYTIQPVLQYNDSNLSNKLFMIQTLKYLHLLEQNNNEYYMQQFNLFNNYVDRFTQNDYYYILCDSQHNKKIAEKLANKNKNVIECSSDLTTIFHKKFSFDLFFKNKHIYIPKPLVFYDYFYEILLFDEHKFSFVNNQRTLDKIYFDIVFKQISSSRGKSDITVNITNITSIHNIKCIDKDANNLLFIRK